MDSLFHSLEVDWWKKKGGPLICDGSLSGGASLRVQRCDGVRLLFVAGDTQATMMTTTGPMLLRSEVKKEDDLCLPIDVDGSPADSSLYSPTTTGGLQLEVRSRQVVLPSFT